MILADLLHTLSQRVIIHDHWSSDLIRMTIATVAAVTAFLLARLYTAHRTGRMNFCAGAGAVSTYVVISWAQLVAISTPSGPHDLTALDLGVLAAVTLSLVGTFQAMEVHLFKATSPRPGRWRHALGQLGHMAETVDSNAGKLDDISHAVNSRAPHHPTISEDVRELMERAEATDREDPQ